MKKPLPCHHIAERLRRRVAVTLATLLAAALPTTALPTAAAAAVRPAQERRAAIQASFTRDANQSINVDVTVGQSRVIEFEQPFDRALTSVEGIARLDPISPTMLVVSGVAAGQVNLIAWSKPAAEGEARRMLVFSISVQNNLSLIDNQIKILFPKENIQISQANGPVATAGGAASGNGIIVLSGSVTDPKYGEQAQKIIEAAGFKVVNMIKLPTLDSAQVKLEIRVAEVNRNVLRELSAAYGGLGTGVPTYINPGGPASFGSYNRSLQNLGGQAGNAIYDIERLIVNPGSAMNLFIGGNNQAFIRALNERGALRSLAEPNLIAMNGKKARFLAGGEYPVPVVQGGAASGGTAAITIEYRQYGIKLDFTPTILDENHIQLDMEPEVSSIDFSTGTQILSTVVPGRRIRQAKTTLELRDGQSFALAGLIDNSEQANISKIPLLGDVPILGELFKSRRFQRSETELMFLVTVHLVEPLNPDQLPRLPGNVGELKTNSPSKEFPTQPPAQPASNAPAAPVNALGPSGVIEGQSGHALPQKHAAPPPAKAAQADTKP